MKRLPVDVSTFSIMINDNYVYVDKTKHIYSMITQGRFYFLSRPRRFGKSLLVSTLRELFLGNKELFKDLWIAKNTDYDWQEYPVINLDFSGIPHHTPEQLSDALNHNLGEIAVSYNVLDAQQASPEQTLRYLIQKLSQKNKVVILIDEYDKPILDHIENIEMAKAQREVLRSFYTVIKSMDQHLRFVLLTGVTRLCSSMPSGLASYDGQAKTSVFSGLNNLNDISMDPSAAALLGCTVDEIDIFLSDYINNFAEKINVSAESVRDQMSTWYNGYRFSESPIKVYNLFSVLYCLHKKDIKNYWFNSGTPSFLIKLIKKQPEILIDTIKQLDIDKINWFISGQGSNEIIDALFQSGYLTIVHIENDMYKLGCPNKETHKALKDILGEYSQRVLEANLKETLKKMTFLEI